MSRIGLIVMLVVVASEARAETRLGAMVDVGVPDGALASLVVKPARWIGIHAGAGTNGVGPGFRAGLTLFPFQGSFGLSFEVGRHLAGDANGLARMVSGDPALDATILDGVGYDWASAHLGLEVGGRVVKVVMQAGASYVDAELGAPAESTGGSVLVRGFVPSARLGLVVYLR